MPRTDRPAPTAAPLLDVFGDQSARAAEIEQRRREHDAQQREQRRARIAASFDAQIDQAVEQQREEMRRLIHSWF